jgi:hypothetical protein
MSRNLTARFLPAQQDRITDDRIPSLHSFVLKSNSPYNSPNETALGFIVNSFFKEKKLLLL